MTRSGCLSEWSGTPYWQNVCRKQTQLKHVEDYIANSRPHRDHDRKHPNRITKLMDEARRHLQEADVILWTADFNDPIHRTAIDALLELSHQFMIMAVEDPATIVGEEIKEIRREAQKAMEKKRKGLPDEVVALIKRLAKREDSLPSELWPSLVKGLDRLSLHPQDSGDGPKDWCVAYEGDNGKPLKFDTFRKRIERYWLARRDTAKR